MTDETIFAVALEKASAGERVEFVAGACDGPEQQARVESLLAAHDRAGRFLDRPAVDLAAADDALTYTPDAAATRTTDPTTGDPDDADATSFLAPPGRPDSLGRIGHYEVLEVLGRGGFGIVFRAFDDVLQRVVAVKVLAPHMAATSPARKRFLREARSAAVIQHEHVVRIHETGETPLPYLVMEFVPGETLQQHMDRTGPLEVAAAVKFARQIAAGLAAAHEKGLIHRDIKPSNVLIDAGGRQAKITDFGLARAADDASLTRSGVVAGTPMYMAPEQARGEPLDQRADLFSLGSVLYAMLTGRPPFRAENTPAVLKRVAEDDPRPIREVIPEVPEWVCRIVGKLHPKDPADRFQTAREVADLLADCEKQLAERRELTDFSRIPGGRPKPARWRWRWQAWAAVWLAVCGLPVAWLAGYLINASWPKTQPSDDRAQLAINWEGKDLVVMVYGEDGIEYLNEGKSKGLGMSLKPGTYTIRAQRGGEVVFERKVTLGPRDHLGVDIPADPPSADGFVSLFNGKDLTGWREFPAGRGSWAVKDGVLVGRGKPSHLFTERGDFANFRLRIELRVRGGEKAGAFGVFGRVPVEDPGVVLSPTTTGQYYRDPVPKLYDDSRPPTGQRPAGRDAPLLFWAGDLKADVASSTEKVPADEWLVYEVVQDRDLVSVRGGTDRGRPHFSRDFTTAKDPRSRSTGHLALQLFDDWSAVEIRKIEIVDLPATASPVVPKTAADVLPYLAGGWKAELENTGPQLPPGETIPTGELTFDFVAGEKFLRQRGGPAGEFGQPHFVYSFDPAQGLRRWVAWAVGATAGPVVGTFNPDSRTLLWMHHIAAEGPYNVEMHFADGDRMKVRTFRLDPDGKIHRETRLVFTRLKRPAAPNLLPTDPTRPAEMAVLDRMVGEWRNEQTVTDAATPDRPKRQTTRTTAGLILGGRFVEEVVANDTTGEAAYTLAWFDTAAKAYRRRFFSGEAKVTELTGAWDAAANSLTWTAADNSVSVSEVFTGDDRSEFQLTFKERGKTVKEVSGTARRVAKAAGGPAANVQPLRDKVAAAQAARDLTSTKFDAGTVSGIEMARADGDLADAKAELALAEGDTRTAATRLGELVEQRQRERDLIALRVKDGLDRAEVLADSDARLAAAKARLAALRPADK